MRAFREYMIANNMTKDNYDAEALDPDQLQGYYLKR